MILIGLGSNLPGAHGTPRKVLELALASLESRGVAILARSGWYESAPVPPSDQPWFVNGVASVSTHLEPHALLALMLEIERRFGRVRTEANAARILDLDLLVWHDLVTEPGAVPELPHPRLSQRAFVLHPMAELVPEFRHPATGETLATMISALPGDQVARRLFDEETHPAARIGFEEGGAKP